MLEFGRCHFHTDATNLLHLHYLMNYGETVFHQCLKHCFIFLAVFLKLSVNLCIPGGKVIDAVFISK